MARLATTDQRGIKPPPEPRPEPMGPTLLNVCNHPQCPTGAGLKAALRKEGQGLEIELAVRDAPTLCRGQCLGGPYVGLPTLGLFYGNVSQHQAAELISETCLSGRLLFQRLLISPAKVTDGRILYLRQEGVLVLLEENRCPLAAAAYLFRFNAGESCGKCTPCRLGVPTVENMLRRLETGEASEEDVQELRLLLNTMARDAYCEFAEKVTAPLRLLMETDPKQIEQHVAGGCPRGNQELPPLGLGGA